MIIKGNGHILDGLIEAAQIISSTLGPSGREVIIHDKTKPFGIYPTKDGVTVAKSLLKSFEGTENFFGAALLLDACSRTVREAGDGTTATAVMAMALVGAVRGSDYDAKFFNRLRDEARVVIEKIKELSSPADKETLVRVATTSANNDAYLGKCIGELIHETGPYGHVVGQKSDGATTYTEIKEGYSFNSGVIIPQFLEGRNAVGLLRPKILIIEQAVNDYKILVPILDAYRKSCYSRGVYTNPLIIIFGDITDSALEIIYQNFFKPPDGQPRAPIYPIKSPLVGSDRFALLEDLCRVIGTKMYSFVDGNTLKDFDKKFGDLQFAELKFGGSRLVFKDNPATAKRIDERVKTLEELAVGDKENSVRERMGKLTGGVGYVHIGGHSESEKASRADLVEDAVLASQASARDGVVPGCGYMFKLMASGVSEELKQMLNAPYDQIMKNAKSEKAFNLGYVDNLVTGKSELSDETGVLDPVTALSSSLFNAISVVEKAYNAYCTIK